MLTPRPHPRPHQQRGIVLLMAMVVLIALTLAGLALTRSVYTSNAIAGNLAFQQAATHAADEGVESAIAWLESNNGMITSPTASECIINGVSLAVLACDQPNKGYVAHKQDPDDGNWPNFWTKTVLNNDMAITLPVDQTGNTVSYLIQRMCTSNGDSQDTSNDCTASPFPTSSSCAGGSSCAAQSNNLASVSQVYYRITVRVVGPRNTQSFVQSIVAL